MRLTKKEKDNDYGVIANDIDLVKCGDNAINKLGKLEDIEEELGIDLITLFEALKNGIYYTNYGHGTINYCDKPKLIPFCIYKRFPNGQVEREVSDYEFIVSKKGLTISLRTYKKYWALTKEELVKENKDE